MYGAENQIANASVAHCMDLIVNVSSALEKSLEKYTFESVKLSEFSLLMRISVWKKKSGAYAQQLLGSSFEKLELR
jgi:hypothetical protein